MKISYGGCGHSQGHGYSHYGTRMTAGVDGVRSGKEVEGAILLHGEAFPSVSSKQEESWLQ